MKNTFAISAWGRNKLHKVVYINPSYVVNRIYYVCGGKGLYKDSVPLLSGHLYLFGADPGFRISHDLSDPFDHLYFDFHTFVKQIEPGIHEIDLTDKPELRHVVLAAAETLRNRETPFEIVESFFRIISYYLKAYYIEMPNLSYTTSEVLRRLHPENLAELSVAKLAQDISVNVDHLIRSFKRDLGTTPHRYIARLKLDMAINYARNGEQTADIAAKLGFTSVSTLSAFVKENTGRNLSSFRAK